jgi:sec-independent protein translocase protein TatB
LELGFLEIILIMIVGLVVIGPERMPEVARSIIYWWGRMKRMVTDTRAELEKEIGADDIRRQLKNEAIMKQLGESKEAIEAALNETTDNIQRFKHIGEQKPRQIASPEDEEIIRQKKIALKEAAEAAEAVENTTYQEQSAAPRNPVLGDADPSKNGKHKPDESDT